MKHDHVFWNELTTHIKSIPKVPSWVTTILGSNLKRKSNSSLELKPVTKSYLDFLQEQIDLKSRGPERNIVLEARLAALKKFEGQNLFFLHVFEDKSDFFLRMKPDNFAIVYWELL